jgi:hypothetical protein
MKGATPSPGGQEDARMLYKGGCHCGRIAFEVETDIKEAIDCNCSHCSKKGYLLAFVPRPQLRLTTPEADLSTYTFHKHVIRHRFCAACGCAPFGEGVGPKGEATVAVNIRCLENLDRGTVKLMPFDGRRL